MTDYIILIQIREDFTEQRKYKNWNLIIEQTSISYYIK